MIETLGAVVLVLSLAAVGMLLVLLRRQSAFDPQASRLRFDALEKNQERIERTLREEMAQGRAESSTQARQTRTELDQKLSTFGAALQTQLAEISGLQKNQLDSFSLQLNALTQANSQKLDLMRETVEKRLSALQADNAKQLEQMRTTVDEKLQGTLEKRLGESFKQVSERLEQVHKGLGEMQSLAAGVGDLKRVLTNVKTRGVLGEIQLGALLEEILTPDQFERNFKPKESGGEMVEFALKLPGPSDAGEPLWLPIDAKFPVEDYQRLVEAQEKVDLAAVEEAGKMLALRIKTCARDIREKYLNPPRTTDFGILFLPTEGLFAEVVRKPGLVETVWRECRVVIAGPTTLSALLNSLQIGFRTLAIQKRSSEVWKLLGAVKNEFGKFGDLLDGVKKKLDQASSTMEEAARKSRTIERKLRDVQELPSAETPALIADSDELPASEVSPSGNGLR